LPLKINQQFFVDIYVELSKLRFSGKNVTNQQQMRLLLHKVILAISQYLVDRTNMRKIQILIVLIVMIGLLAFFLYPRPSGYVKVDTPGASVCLKTGWWRTVILTDKMDKFALKAGKSYEVRNANISAEKNNDTWRLRTRTYSSGSAIAECIKVRKDETTIVKVGGPFTIKTDVKGTGQFVSIGLSIVGRAGEKYFTRPMKKGKVVPEPKLEIIDEAGNVLNSGQFEYG